MIYVSLCTNGGRGQFGANVEHRGAFCLNEDRSFSWDGRRWVWMQVAKPDPFGGMVGRGDPPSYFFFERELG